jgi:hypothetical protein
MAKTVEIKNLNMGGIADSDYLGGKASVAEAVGLDIHSESGLIKVNQALTKESGSTVDDLVKARVACSDGKTYLFGSTNGKIWSRASNGTYTLEATASPAAGAAGILDAQEYNGYIYYAMQSRLGRWQLGTAWSTRNDSWATFTNTDDTYHPMRVLNIVLYIGDKNYLAQVDAGTFSANALDLETKYRITALGRAGTDILLGTIVAGNVITATRFRWNTWSVSFSSQDDIPEVGVNAFLEGDNYAWWSAGLKGNIYIDNGSLLDMYKTVKGVFNNSSKQGKVNANAVLNFAGLPLFGFSNVSGNAAPCGVYSLGRTNRNYPFVLNLEYLISTLNSQNVEIGAIIGVGDIFLVCWKDTNGGTTYGVDKLDLTLKHPGAYLTSRIIMANRTVLTRHTPTYVPYRSLPTGTSIEIHAKLNNGTMTQIPAANVKVDTDRQQVYTDIDVGEATKLQEKIKLVASGNDAPEVEAVLIGVDV